MKSQHYKLNPVNAFILILTDISEGPFVSFLVTLNEWPLGKLVMSVAAGCLLDHHPPGGKYSTLMNSAWAYLLLTSWG